MGPARQNDYTYVNDRERQFEIREYLSVIQFAPREIASRPKIPYLLGYLFRIVI